jgi:hypothetical protein
MSGRGAAVAEIGEGRLSGRGTWLAWRTIHIFSLRGLATEFGPGGVGLDFCARSAARLIIGEVATLLERGPAGRADQPPPRRGESAPSSSIEHRGNLVTLTKHCCIRSTPDATLCLVSCHRLTSSVEESPTAQNG